MARSSGRAGQRPRLLPLVGTAGPRSRPAFASGRLPAGPYVHIGMDEKTPCFTGNSLAFPGEIWYSQGCLARWPAEGCNPRPAGPNPVVAWSPNMASVSPKPPVRHGSCRLCLLINSDEYIIKRLASGVKGSRLWRLKKNSGERAGAVYFVARSQGEITCTCPDHSNRGARCKHIRSLVAAGLLSGRARKGVARA